MLKQKHLIDAHKMVTFLALLGLMAWFDRWQNPTAWVYLALHGSYGLLWALKGQIFPDKQFDVPAAWWFVPLSLGGLSLYWGAGFIINAYDVQAPAWLLGLAVSMNLFGVFFHFTSDMQKYVALHLQPGHLVKDGLFARVRNINYFGELLIYLSFALLSMHWIPLAILAAYVLGYWVPSMFRKDKSLSRYPDFAEYKRGSRLFLPFLF